MARLFMIIAIAIIASSVGAFMMWAEYGLVCNKSVTDHLQKHSNLFDDTFDGTFAINAEGFPFGVHGINIQECVNHVLEKRNADKTAERMLSSEHTGMDDVGKLLAQNRINYNPDTLVVTGGPSTGGDPGCGAVIDADLQTRWFEIDSISEPQRMIVYSENPHPCKVNATSCFCNAQTELTYLTLDDLSYFTPEEEGRYAEILLKHIKNNAEMKNIEPKFRIGKLNLSFTDPDAIGYCGERPGDNRNDFFSGAIVNGHVEDYGLDRELPLLCAIPGDATWWEQG